MAKKDEMHPVDAAIAERLRAWRERHEQAREHTFRVWRPEIGDCLEGNYDGFEVVPGSPEYGDAPFNAHRIVDTKTGELFTLTGATLDRVFIREGQVQHVGKDVFVVYEGYEDLDGGRRMRFYRVFVGK
jgi:hypothetical protein